MAASLRFLRTASRSALRQCQIPTLAKQAGGVRFNTSGTVNWSPGLPDLPSVCRRLFDAKAKKGLSFGEIGKVLGKDEIWTAALFYGQAKPAPEDIEKLSNLLGVPLQHIKDRMGDHWWPSRGLGPDPPMDPVIYRLHEGVLVYGYPIKAVIHEKFGDGIMSLIDCHVTVDRKPHEKGDRVVLTFDGKFLPYAKW